jgi:3-phenylpropionate/trans-cinnamate dioxygenase ferredoxin reductase subunit
MSGERIVIVGGGLGGLRTAERLRRLGHDGPVTLVAAERHLPYDRPPLSKTLLAQHDEPPAPVFLRAPDRFAELGLDLRTGSRATALDARSRQLTLDTGETLDFQRLVIATGVRPRRLEAFDGVAGVHTLRTWEDCVALRAELRDARHVTVIGAGVLGCEIAASARARGIEVALVEFLEQPLARVLGRTVGEIIATLHRNEGVKVHCSTAVSHPEGAGRVERVRFADGSALPTDLVVVAVGATPNTEWLDGSGVEVRDGALCDRAGRTSVDGIFAVGDIARMPHPYGDGTVRVEHWTSAGDTASVVARNLVADRRDHQELAEVPYFWSDQYDTKIQCLGLPAADDDLTVAAGSLEAGRFLALYSRDEVVTGAVTLGMPAALARCRTAIAARTSPTDLLVQAPWDRTGKPTA